MDSPALLAFRLRGGWGGAGLIRGSRRFLVSSTSTSVGVSASDGARIAVGPRISVGACTAALVGPLGCWGLRCAGLAPVSFSSGGSPPSPRRRLRLRSSNRCRPAAPNPVCWLLRIWPMVLLARLPGLSGTTVRRWRSVCGSHLVSQMP